MIKLVNVSKKFKQEAVLKSINLELPRYGLIAIVGPSGCGKSTLLNCLGGLLDYEGNIIIDDTDISKLNDEKKSAFRLRNIGFIFQDFKLFDLETVERNVLFPLDTLSNIKDKHKKRKCLDLCELVGLKSKVSQRASVLSGGEKQRVAIARALVNDPQILLCDEPTGALDSKTAIEIMDIFLRVAEKTLVIIVSHDEDLMEKYADRIIHMYDGKISNISYRNKNKHNIYLPVRKNTPTNKKPSVTTQFLMHHTFSTIKKRKGRMAICNLITSFALIGIGLSISLSSSISDNIKATYSSIVEDNQIMVSLKNNRHISYEKYAGSYYEAMEIAAKYPQYVLDVGVNYYVNFEQFFKDRNEFAVASTAYRAVVDGISARHINEFRWLDYETPQLYPGPVDSLAEDEVVMALTIDMVESICYALKITRTVTSLSDYLKENELLFAFDFENNDWQYNDQQIVKLKAFSLEKQGGFYHYNHLWNEYMFEERMRFPTNDSIDKHDYYPWVMKKMPYFHTNGNPDDFLKEVSEASYGDDYLFEIANTTFYPWLYRDVDVKDRQRILFFANLSDHIPMRLSDNFIELDSHISKPIYGSLGGYSFYPSSMMSGFSKMMYFSFSEELLEKVMDANSTLTLKEGQSSELPKGVLSGHFSKTLQNGVKFAVFDGDLLTGSVPKTLDEIVVSKGFLLKTLGTLNIDNRKLQIAFTSNEITNSNGDIYRDYITKELTVVGVTNSSNYTIYHDSYWTVGYFKSRLGVSAFDLVVDTIALELTSSSYADSVIVKLTRGFPQYDVVNPFDGITESINQVCSYIRIAVAIFSIVSIIISILLLSICNYLFLIEGKKDIALARCIGTNKKESKKFSFMHSILMCLISFILASVELFVVNLLISYELSKNLSGNFIFSFNPLSLVLMLIFTFFIGGMSHLVVSRNATSISPLEALKQ